MPYYHPSFFHCINPKSRIQILSYEICLFVINKGTAPNYTFEVHIVVRQKSNYYAALHFWRNSFILIL